MIDMDTITEVCDYLHKDGRGKLANRIMYLFSKKYNDQLQGRLDSQAQLYRDIVEYSCLYCENMVHNECDIHKEALDTLKSNPHAVALTILIRCEHLKDRIRQGREDTELVVMEDEGEVSEYANLN